MIILSVDIISNFTYSNFPHYFWMTENSQGKGNGYLVILKGLEHSKEDSWMIKGEERSTSDCLASLANSVVTFC